MNSKKINVIKLLAVSFIFIFNSCSSEKVDYNEGDDILKINILGIDESYGDLDKLGSTNSKSFEQKIRVPYGNGLSVLATLSPLSNNSFVKEKISATTTNNLPKGTNPPRELAVGTKYLLLAYNMQGVKVAEREYSYQVFNPNNKGDVNTGFENLQIGQSYIFIVCSNNTTTSVPTISDKQNLSTAIVSNVSDETQLLYFQDTVKINTGVNYLNVKLKHVFSEVSTEIIIDQTGSSLVENISYSHAGSVLRSMNTPALLPAFETASFKLSDKSISYGKKIENGKIFNVPTISESGVKVLKLPSTRIIAKDTAATLDIANLTVNGYTRGLKLEGFKIKPGVRYSLKVEIGCPCLKDVTPTQDIDRPQHTTSYTSTFDYVGADFGVVLDIYKIDNSFQLKINNTHIYTGSTANNSTSTATERNEIEFQGFNKYPISTSYPNIEFEDGSRYGVNVNETYDIWEFDGFTSKKPIVRIQISKEGDVRMMGSKNINGGEPFYPLRLINNKTVTTTNGSRYIRGSFNKVVWKKGKETNKVELYQTDYYGTSFVGFITGKAVIACSGNQ